MNDKHGLGPGYVGELVYTRTIGKSRTIANLSVEKWPHDAPIRSKSIKEQPEILYRVKLREDEYGLPIETLRAKYDAQVSALKEPGQ